MPVVALATTEAPEAVPVGTGVLSTRVEVLARAIREFVEDPDAARETGIAARAFARARYGLERFSADWDALLGEAVAR
jgi:glycosyltransferase involved in cell wall biosynthesis